MIHSVDLKTADHQLVSNKGQRFWLITDECK